MNERTIAVGARLRPGESNQVVLPQCHPRHYSSTAVLVGGVVLLLDLLRPRKSIEPASRNQR